MYDLPELFWHLARNKLLGEGTFGRVFLGFDKVTQEKVAIKEFRRPTGTGTDPGISFTACREIAVRLPIFSI